MPPVLVPIKYVLDTSDLDKAKNASKQAQAATDTLGQSAQKMGTSFSDASRRSVTSIENMTVQLARLKAQIQLTTDPTKLNQLSEQYKKLRTELDATNKKYLEQAKAIKGVQAETQALSVGFGTLIGAVKLFLAAGIVRETVNIAIEMARLSGNLEGVKRAFDRLPGSVLLLEDLRKATQGTVTDFELMQRSLQAKNFRIPLEQLAKLFEFATVRAQQTGQSVDYLINSIVFGLGFQSIRRLDNVGISAAELRDVMKQLGVSLNEAFNIVVNREIERMGGLVKTAATEVAVLEKNFQDLKTSLSQRLTNSSWIQFLSESLRGLSVLAKSLPDFSIIFSFGSEGGLPGFLRAWNKGVEETIRSERNLKTASEELRVVQQSLGETNRQQADGLIQETIARRANIRDFESLIEKKKAEIKLNDLVNKSNLETRVQYLKTRDQLNSDLKALQNRLQIDQIVVGELSKMLKALFDAQPQVLGLIEAKLKEIEDVADDIKTAKSRKEIHDLNNELSILKGQLADLEAFGTTKQFLEVNGKIKLVPVIDPKDFKKTIEAEPLFKKGVAIPLKFDVNGIPTEVTSGTRSATDQLQKEIQELIARMRFNIGIPVSIAPITPESEWDKFTDALNQHLGDIENTVLDSTSTLLNAQLNAEVDGLTQRMKALKDYYDVQQILAGDNEKYKSRLRLKEEKEIQELTRKRADAEKKAAKGSILVNTALGIIKAIATATSIYDGLVKSAIVAAEGAAQYAAADKARYYAKGKVNIDGPGTSTSDSIKANISKGESIIAAKPTSKSLKLLEGINAGKIDDQILNRLHLGKNGIKIMPADNSGVEKAIKDIRFPDVVRIGSETYDQKVANDGFSKKLKRRTMS